MILLPHCLVQQSDQIAEIVCRSYSIGVKEASRALDMRDVALDPAVQESLRQLRLSRVLPYRWIADSTWWGYHVGT